MKSTDLKYCKDTAKLLLYLDLKTYDDLPVITHPFFNSAFFGMKKEIINLFEGDNLEKAREFLSGIIDKADDLSKIFMLLNKPYEATYFNLVCQHLSEKDYNEYLEFVWTDSENPNQDVNVSRSRWITLFKKANKLLLMSQEDLEHYRSLPNDKPIEIYRGVGKGRARLGLSWTGDYETAEWFAKRWGDKGYILKAKVMKEDIFAFFNGRGENELVTNFKKIFEMERIELDGNNKEAKN